LGDTTTVTELVDRWLEDIVRHRVAARAYESYEMVARNHIKPTFGSKPVVELTVAVVLRPCRGIGVRYPKRVLDYRRSVSAAASVTTGSPQCLA
jgi:hypothetical protein